MKISKPKGTSKAPVKWDGEGLRCTYDNIDPTGDPLRERQIDDNITRMGLHNIRGTTMGQGFDVAEELEVIRDLGVDIQAFNEINKPWNASNKWKYEMMTDVLFKQTRSTYCAMEAEYDSDYQPGGNFILSHGTAAARYKKRRIR